MLHLPNLGKGNLPIARSTDAQMVCGLLNHLAVMWWCQLLFLCEALLEIRRGVGTNIAWVFVWLEMNCLITYQQEVLIICHHYITTSGFNKPQTKSGHL